MSSVNVMRPQVAFAGQMTEGEIRFCDAVQKVIATAVQSRAPFSSVVCRLWEDLQALRRYSFDVDAAVSSGVKLAVEDPAAALPKPCVPSSQGPLSQLEMEFLEDVRGLIDFASRNGLNFFAVLSVLAHDLGEIVRHGGSIERARSESFVALKATGWAKRNAQPVGEPQDEGEPGGKSD